jgi:sodium-dependent dicarboxylate transporter 2/3/5
MLKGKSPAYLIRQKPFSLFLGPAVFLSSLFAESPDPGHPHIYLMTGITFWVALWWLTEALPIAVTAFIPFLFIPLCGISNYKTISYQYMDPVIFLFIGGFILSFAIERWGLHHRLALGILHRSGTTFSGIQLGIMSTAFLISMWISNTATAMMLFSAVMGIIERLRSSFNDEEQHRKAASTLMISLAYACSIGGMATLVGTPTNMIFYRAFTEQYGNNSSINFSSWFLFAFPASLILLYCAWLFIRWPLRLRKESLIIKKNNFSDEFRKLGKWSKDEKSVAFIFITTALLWFTRAELHTTWFRFKGWASLFPHPEEIYDGTVAIFMALLLFIIPSQTEKGRALVNWSEASRIPFDIILLFGSGFAIAKGFEDSGLSNYLAGKLESAGNIHPLILVILICCIVTLISEFASNVASIQLALPVLISLQQALELNPLLLMVPAALCASLGFMLPVATAPNTIAYSSKFIKVKEMTIAGLLTDIAGIIIISLLSFLLFA